MDLKFLSGCGGFGAHLDVGFGSFFAILTRKICCDLPDPHGVRVRWSIED